MMNMEKCKSLTTKNQFAILYLYEMENKSFRKAGNIYE